MSNVDVAPGGSETQSIAPAPSTPAEDTSAPLSPSEAGRRLSQWRSERRKQESQAPAEDTPPVETPELADANAAPPQEAPGETATPEPEADELPPIEAPRSWTKEDKEIFAALPRETQAKLAERDRAREIEFRRSQNEAADKLKGLSTKEQEVEAARQKYEQALPALLQALEDQKAGQFADVKSIADIERLAQEDPFRYLQWQAHQQKVAAVHQQVKEAQDRQQQEYAQKWNDFASRQDQAFLEKFPEYTDKKAMSEFSDKAISVLKDVGFEDKDLHPLWHGQTSLSLRDHKVQALIHDAVKYREAKSSLDKAKSQPQKLPPVQRPGAAQPNRGGALIEQLDAKLNQSGSLRDAARLRAARLAQARR